MPGFIGLACSRFPSLTASVAQYASRSARAAAASPVVCAEPPDQQPGNLATLCAALSCFASILRKAALPAAHGMPSAVVALLLTGIPRRSPTGQHNRE